MADAGGRARDQCRLSRKIDFHETSPSLMTEISGAGRGSAIAVRPRPLPNKKAAQRAPPLKPSSADLRRFCCLFLLGAGIEALGVDVAVDEFDHGHRRVIAIAKAGLDDAGIAALPVLVAGSQRVEQLPGHVAIAHLPNRLPAHGKTALLAERDQP